MAALASFPFDVQAVNSNHAGAEFGVVAFEPSLTNPTLEETRALLALDGWSTVQPVPSPRGICKFLVSRKK